MQMKADDGIGRRSRRGKAPQHGRKNQGVYDLNDQRIRALERVKASIAEMEDVERGTSAEAPSRYLIAGVLKTLRKTEARLEAGVRGHRDTCQTETPSQ